jgi:hypothetical protein
VYQGAGGPYDTPQAYVCPTADSISFLFSKVGFAVDIAIQIFLRSCRQAVDIDDVSFGALDFSSLQSCIIGFSFDIVRIGVLRPKTPT